MKELKVLDMEVIRKRIVFHGDVQGVGFRYRANYLAQYLGLTGWVRNEYDGTVFMEVQGSSKAIDDMVLGLQNGTYITIDWMDVKTIPLESEYGFYTE